MLSSEFNQVVDILRTVVRNVSRLSNERSPRWFRHVVEEKQQKLRLNEVQEFKRASVAILAVINDADMRQEPLPWGVLKRHAENVPLWLDRLVKTPERYEIYKNRLLMSIDTFVQNADKQRVPLSRPSTYRSTAAGLLFALVGGIAGLTGCAPARLYAEEPKVEEKAPADLPQYAKNLDDFLKQTNLSEDYVKKQMDKEVSAILKDSKIKCVKYDEKTKTNDYEDLLKKGCGKYVVLFGSFKRDDKTSELTKRSLIQADVMARLFNGFVEVIYFDEDVDPSLKPQNYVALKDKFEVFSTPTMQLTSYDKGAEKIIKNDSKQGGPASTSGTLTAIYNGIVNWTFPLFFGTPTDDGKKYKYQNTGKLQEIAQK